MTALGFDNYVEPLKIYLQKYREVSFLGSCLRSAVSLMQYLYFQTTKGDKSLNHMFEEVTEDVFRKF